MGAAAGIWRLKCSIPLLVVMQAFDTLSTLLALGRGLEEGDPVADRLLDEGAAIVIAKRGVVALAFLAVAVAPLEKGTGAVTTTGRRVRFTSSTGA